MFANPVPVLSAIETYFHCFQFILAHGQPDAKADERQQQSHDYSCYTRFEVSPGGVKHDHVWVLDIKPQISIRDQRWEKKVALFWDGYW